MKRSWTAGLVLIATCCAQTTLAQGYPSKSIRLFVPFPPGGGSDFIARVSAQKLAASTGQQVIVDNRPGAGGTLGVELGMRAPADGYTLTLIATSYSVNPKPPNNYRENV